MAAPPFDEKLDRICWDYLEQARAGSSAALGSLLQLFEKPLLAYARRELPAELRGRMGGSDLFQDALIRAIQKFPEFTGNNARSIGQWLFEILKTTTLDRLRDNKRSKRDVTREVGLPEGEQEVAAAGAPPPDEAAARELARYLGEAIAALPEEDTCLLALHFSDELSFEAVGEVLGCSAEAARKRCSTILRTIRRHLDRGTGANPSAFGTDSERAAAYARGRRELLMRSISSGASIGDLAALLRVSEPEARRLCDEVRLRLITR